MRKTRAFLRGLCPPALIKSGEKDKENTQHDADEHFNKLRQIQAQEIGVGIYRRNDGDAITDVMRLYGLLPDRPENEPADEY